MIAQLVTQNPRIKAAIFNHERTGSDEAAAKVAQTSKSAVSRVSKPASCADSRTLPIGKSADTAGFETCATAPWHGKKFAQAAKTFIDSSTNRHE